MTEPEAPEAAPEAATDVPAEQAAPQQDGVLIVVNPGPDGSFQTGIQLIGGTRVTEVQTLLECALRDFRKAVGLSA